MKTILVSLMLIGSLAQADDLYTDGTVQSWQQFNYQQQMLQQMEQQTRALQQLQQQQSLPAYSAPEIVMPGLVPYTQYGH